jgi:nitrogen regulatory protein PII
MKLVFIVYNAAIDEDVMEALARLGIEEYTKWPRLTGQGKTSGPHLDSAVWPGVNSALLIATDETEAQNLLKEVRSLKKKLAHEGIKAFLFPLEEIC